MKAATCILTLRLIAVIGSFHCWQACNIRKILSKVPNVQFIILQQARDLFMTY